MRFQVALPTPLAPLDFFSAADQARLLPLFEARLIAEVAAIAAAVPPAELAIQWDTAVEFAMLEGVWPSPYGSPAASRQPIVDLLGRIGDAVPDGVELGYHLCYGDAANKHFVEPRDAGHLADVASGVLAGVRRHVDWIHLPVPLARADTGYFAPLQGVDFGSTELYLGLLHLADGIPGAQARIAAASAALDREFGLATECGFGRQQPATVPALLHLHAALTRPVD